MARFKSFTQILTALSALNAVSTVLRSSEVGSAEWTTFYAVFGAATSAGVITIEAAHSPTYSGTWASLGTITWAAANRVHSLTVQGSHMALRARISTAIVGGTVDVYVNIAN